MKFTIGQHIKFLNQQQFFKGIIIDSSTLIEHLHCQFEYRIKVTSPSFLKENHLWVMEREIFVDYYEFRENILINLVPTHKSVIIR